ncbi:hypothetical protein HOLleu_24073 [Holothuria leucospilota]|uniref:Uncharacterized protein n=1 Tax=Holothuria leucospilota TaxID=206669 RepID=A0A9Q1BVW1_HOLLE|nr:hypothetical protein HOLleu_24073 [Holothuria leucospilota]
MHLIKPHYCFETTRRCCSLILTHPSQQTSLADNVHELTASFPTNNFALFASAARQFVVWYRRRKSCILPWNYYGLYWIYSFSVSQDTYRPSQEFFSSFCGDISERSVC